MPTPFDPFDEAQRAVLRDYVGQDDERLFDSESLNSGLEFDLLPAYLLGVDLGRFIDADERKMIDTFCTMASSQSDRHGTHAEMLVRAPASFDRKPEELTDRLDALRRGLDVGAG